MLNTMHGPRHARTRRYNVGRVHEQLNATLYAVHWVWAGGSFSSKRQGMREAAK